MTGKYSHDMHDVLDIQSSSRDAGTNHQGTLACTERPHGVLTLVLGAGRVNARDREPGFVEECVDFIALAVGVAEDNSATRRH